MATKKDSIEEYYEKQKEDSPKGKSSGEKRSFQIAPGVHKDLTRSEAEEKGFHWGDISSAEVGRGLAPKAPPGHESAK